MNWLVVLDKMMKKPPVFVIVTLVVFIVLLVSKWQMNLPLQALWFFIGGVVGIYALDLAEILFKLSPSPFRSVFFSLLLTIVALFLIISSREYIARGLVLSLLLNLYMLYVNDWVRHRSVQSWYDFFFGAVSFQIQKNTVVLYGVVVVFLCFLFVMS